MNINVVIADDEELFRIGMGHILSRDSDINISFEASDGMELLDYLDTCEELPDIILTDIKMPKLNGVEATKVISQKYKEIGIIALTTYNSKPFIRNMIAVGASAYLVKNSPPEKVMYTIKQVYYKGFYYDSQVLQVINERTLAKNCKTDKSFFDMSFITSREKQVLELICKQNTTAEIAEELYISPRTVDVHRKNLIEKTGVKNVAGLVIFALRNDLVPPIIE